MQVELTKGDLRLIKDQLDMTIEMNKDCLLDYNPDHEDHKSTVDHIRKCSSTVNKIKCEIIKREEARKDITSLSLFMEVYRSEDADYHELEGSLETIIPFLDKLIKGEYRIKLY